MNKSRFLTAWAFVSHDTGKPQRDCIASEERDLASQFSCSHLIAVYVYKHACTIVHSQTKADRQPVAVGELTGRLVLTTGLPALTCSPVSDIKSETFSDPQMTVDVQRTSETLEFCDISRDLCRNGSVD